MPTNADQSCRIRVGREAVFIGSTVLAKLTVQTGTACTQPHHMTAAVSEERLTLHPGQRSTVQGDNIDFPLHSHTWTAALCVKHY